MTVLRHLKAETLRECYLVRLRATRALTPEELAELRFLQKTAVQRACDEAAELRPEGRLLRPFRANIHEN